MAQASHRERLIEGALECLKTKGYARTSARDIAAAADANLASISYHFGSKEALLNEALHRVSEGWTQRLGAHALAEEDAAAVSRIMLAYEAAIQAFADSSAYRALFASFIEAIAQAAHAPELRTQLADHYEAARAIVAELIRSALDGDADPGVDPDALASFFIAVYDGFLIQALLDPDRLPDARRVIDSLALALEPGR